MSKLAERAIAFVNACKKTSEALSGRGVYLIIYLKVAQKYRSVLSLNRVQLATAIAVAGR
jgi:hypothetical protein